MNLWKDLVDSNKIPTEVSKKIRYNAERLVCSAIVQEYHVLIEKGLEYSYLTNGIARVLLRVPYDDPSTLYYFFCEPNREIEPNLQAPNTSIAHVLCLCLMAFRSPVRDQAWKHNARSNLRRWKPTLTILVLRFPRKNCSNFLDQLTVVSIPIWVRRSPVRTINRRHLYLNLLRNKVVGCLLGLSLPDRHRMYDNVRSHQTHRVLIQTKQDGNVASVESHPPRLVDKGLETTEVTSHNATMRNIAPAVSTRVKDWRYSGRRLPKRDTPSTRSRPSQASYQCGGSTSFIENATRPGP
jgi:hypothetical protein